MVQPPQQLLFYATARHGTDTTGTSENVKNWKRIFVHLKSVHMNIAFCPKKAFVQNAINSLRQTSQLYNQDIFSSESPQFSDGSPSQTPSSNHTPGGKMSTAALESRITLMYLSASLCWILPPPKHSQSSPTFVTLIRGKLKHNVGNQGPPLPLSCHRHRHGTLQKCSPSQGLSLPWCLPHRPWAFYIKVRNHLFNLLTAYCGVWLCLLP